jgi:Mg2+ and Co2+ transporter CorA
MPIEGITPSIGIPVEVLPLTYGQSRMYKSFGESLFNWTDEEKMKLINDHIVTANNTEIHIKDLDDMYDNYDAWTVEDLVQAVYIFSGLGRLYEGEPEGNVGREAPQES